MYLECCDPSYVVFFFKQKTAYEMRISDWSSDVCSSDLGEGVHAGRRAVFLRFAGCNLWTGREQDRASAVCRFCDTDFVGTDGDGGGRFADADGLADAALALWGEGRDGRYIVLTGGDTMLQEIGRAHV